MYFLLVLDLLKELTSNNPFNCTKSSLQISSLLHFNLVCKCIIRLKIHRLGRTIVGSASWVPVALVAARLSDKYMRYLGGCKDKKYCLQQENYAAVFKSSISCLCNYLNKKKKKMCIKY